MKCKCSLHLTHPKRIRTWSSGQPSYSARGAVRGSVPCSRALQSWYWTQFLPARDSNPRTVGYQPDSLTIRPRLPLKMQTVFAFNMLWYSTPWTATPFSNDPLWFTLFVEGVNDRLLDHCQVSSVPHYCAFKEQEIPRIYTVWIVIYWNSNLMSTNQQN